jgi:cysteinyl-tRNA synthetase
MISLYNTATRKIETFTAQQPNKVSIYTCGPTVYDYPQIGNWVAYIRWDILVRLFKAQGYDVTRVMNITDVGHLVSDADEGEDKLEKGAKREGKTAWEVAAYYTDDFIKGMAKLNILSPEFLTKATDYIQQQIDLVKVLETKGYTYKISDGIYYDTSKFKAYADFARLDLNALKAGARVDYNYEKKNPSDFALWKFTPTGHKRDMEWDSPWGKGFPGWHLECSAMAIDKLGSTLDIHTGGIDHIPVHHTNEIAQSEAATGKKFANYWIHNNFLMVDGAKAAKSLGNAYTLQDLEKLSYSPQEFKMFVLQSHYRTASNFTWDNLDSARNRLLHWRKVADLTWQPLNSNSNQSTADFNKIKASLLESLNNDIDTPEVMAKIDAFISTIANGINKSNLKEVIELFYFIEVLLGLDLLGPDITEEQKLLILERSKAKQEKNWQKSDTIRTELNQQGIIIKDILEGQIWERAQ